MKRIRNIIIALITVLATSVQYSSAENTVSEKVSFIFPNAPSYVQSYENPYFDIVVQYTGKGERNYTAVYVSDADNAEHSESFTVQSGSEFTKRIYLQGLKKGLHNLKITVTGGKEAYTHTQVLGLIEFYKQQYLEEFLRTAFVFSINSSFADTVNMEEQAKLAEWAGIKRGRFSNSGTWPEREKTKGIYNFIGTTTWYKYFKNVKIGSRGFSGANGHTMYLAPDGTKAPKTYEQLCAFRNYNQAFMDRAELSKNYSDGDVFIAWNEPNLPHFWPTKHSSVDEYSNYRKMMYLFFKDQNIDAPFIDLDIAGSNPIPYIRTQFELDSYYYCDGFSFHPYTFPQIVDQSCISNMRKYMEVDEDYGGWMEKYITEIGYPTAQSTQGIDPAKQDDYMVKTFVFCDQNDIQMTYWYNFRDRGEDKTDRESTFGIVNYDWTPKYAYTALPKMNMMMAGSFYVGRTVLGEGITAHVYVKEGKPFMIAWVPEMEGEEDIAKSYDFKTESVKFEDIYGNPVQNGSVLSVGWSPMYVTGIDSIYMYMAAATEVCEDYNKIIEKYGKKIDVTQIKSLLDGANAISSIGAEKYLYQNYEAGKIFFDNYENGKLTLEEASTGLWLLQQAAVRIATLVADIHPGGVSSVSAIKKADEKISLKKGEENYAALKLTDKIMFQARKFNKNAVKINDAEENTGRNALIRGFDIMASELCAWAERMSEYETVNTNVGLNSVTYPSKATTYPSLTEEFSYTIENHRKKTLNGEVTVVDETGKEVAERVKLSVAEGGYFQTPLFVKIDERKAEGSYAYWVKVIEDGDVVHTSRIPIDVSGVVNAQIEKQSVLFEDLESINVELQNIFKEDIEVEVGLTPPEGWKFEKESIKVTVPKGETIKVPFDILQKTKRPLNEYLFNLKITNNYGNYLLDKQVPQILLMMTKMENAPVPAEFDGSLENWTDAYPIYLTKYMGEELSLEKWEEANVAARAFAKWDDNYFYYLVDVYDDYHSNMFKGSGNWNGDSVQVVIDTLNDKSAAYDKNDYEYNFSYASDGNDIWAFYAAEGSQTGAVSPDWMKVVRDNEHNTTRYFIRIPQSGIQPFVIREGAQLGWNIAVNDGDLLERERSIEFTAGITSQKNPSYYCTFTLAGTSVDKFEDVENTITGFRYRLNNVFNN